MSPFGIVGIFRRCPDADELRHCFGLDVLDEGVELLVDGGQPHLDLALVLPVLLRVNVVAIQSRSKLVMLSTLTSRGTAEERITFRA